MAPLVILGSLQLHCKWDTIDYHPLLTVMKFFQTLIREEAGSSIRNDPKGSRGVTPVHSPQTFCTVNLQEHLP